MTSAHEGHNTVDKQAQERFDTHPELQAAVTDAINHPERAVPRRDRSTFWDGHEVDMNSPEYAKAFAEAEASMYSGPGHAASCGKKSVHPRHRHTRGEEDLSGYEVCSGVNPPQVQRKPTVTAEQLEKAVEALLEAFRSPSGGSSPRQMAEDATRAAFTVAGFDLPDPR